jgi:Cysteine rich repeat
MSESEQVYVLLLIQHPCCVKRLCILHHFMASRQLGSCGHELTHNAEGYMQLEWDCQAELFKIDVEDADDIRLSVRLFRTCLTDKRKFCPDVAPGNGRAKACLEEHRKESGFSPECKCVPVILPLGICVGSAH